MRILARARYRPAPDLFATYSTGEEPGEAEIGRLKVLGRGYRAPLIVYGEPTSLRVAPATMGWFFFRFAVEGKSPHPAARYAAVYPKPGEAPPAEVDARINEPRDDTAPPGVDNSPARWKRGILPDGHDVLAVDGNSALYDAAGSDHESISHHCLNPQAWHPGAA